jgi:hypothetical protein
VRIAFGEPVTFEGQPTYADAATALRDQVAAMWADIDRATPNTSDRRRGSRARQQDA